MENKPFISIHFRMNNIDFHFTTHDGKESAKTAKDLIELFQDIKVEKEN